MNRIIARLFFLACLVAPSFGFAQAGTHPGPSSVGCPLCTSEATAAFEGYPRRASVYRAQLVDNDVRISRAQFVPAMAGSMAYRYVDKQPHTVDAWRNSTAAVTSLADQRQIKLLSQEYINPSRNEPDEDVFFCNETDSDVNPAVLGLKNATLVSGIGDLKDSVKRRLALNQKSAAPLIESAKAFSGLASTTKEVNQVFAEGTTVAASVWNQERRRFIAEANALKLTVVESRLMTKAEFLEELQSTATVITVTAHADGGTIYFPGKEPISLAVKEIAELDLSLEPFVFLRVCESKPGDNLRVAAAFLYAGAKGVNINTGAVEASVATDDVIAFMKALKDARTVQAALDRLPASSMINAKTLTLLRREFTIGVAELVAANSSVVPEPFPL